MKTSVGSISRRADSAIPNMFTNVSTASPISDTSRRCAESG